MAPAVACNRMQPIPCIRGVASAGRCSTYTRCTGIVLRSWRLCNVTVSYVRVYNTHCTVQNRSVACSRGRQCAAFNHPADLRTIDCRGCLASSYHATAAAAKPQQKRTAIGVYDLSARLPTWSTRRGSSSTKKQRRRRRRRRRRPLRRTGHGDERARGRAPRLGRRPMRPPSSRRRHRRRRLASCEALLRGRF